MADFPYVLTSEKFKEFMNKIVSTGMPPIANKQYLDTLGFKSSNDRRFIQVLKTIEFLDGSGKPTEAWIGWKDTKNGPTVLGAQIKKGYSGLFLLHPKAHLTDKEALRNYFATESKLGDESVGAMVNTFKALCELAVFDDSGSGVVNTITEIPSLQAPSEIGKTTSESTVLQGLSINIQLTLPESTDPAVYREIFKAMKEHLIGSSK
ncbi:MAG: DUF5343 domain-containing protein [Chloroflexi bacterium]|nr:DUF5343 domain-containing protein [Chloroflexota bacterium]